MPGQKREIFWFQRTLTGTSKSFNLYCSEKAMDLSPKVPIPYKILIVSCAIFEHF